MFARVCAVVILAAAGGAAQTVSPGLEHANPEMTAPAQREVRERVEEFLRKLGRRDAAGVRAMLAPKALIAVVRQQRDGTFANSYRTGEEFLAELGKSVGQPAFEEPIANVVVTIDSERLAYVRADFTIVREGTTLSSGVDHFTLLKERDGWKIAFIGYTSLPR